ncbi:MAG TPA: hypothetical protein VMF89_29950, partial [Polyangiales bacterium]|nr:hypothetical protein [Polyangiales bacterium]
APLFSSQGLSRLAYRAELDRLAEISMRRSFGETRERFADRMATLSPSFVLLTQQHLAAKFARQGEVDADQVRQVSRAVAREVRGRVSWWRRWLGALLPWSWLLSR